MSFKFGHLLSLWRIRVFCRQNCQLTIVMKQQSRNKPALQGILHWHRVSYSKYPASLHYRIKTLACLNDKRIPFLFHFFISSWFIEDKTLLDHGNYKITWCSPSAVCMDMLAHGFLTPVKRRNLKLLFSSVSISTSTAKSTV